MSDLFGNEKGVAATATPDSTLDDVNKSKAQLSPRQVAKHWQDAGFRVFPIVPGTKEPRFKGYQAGTDDVAAHWTRYPDDRVGLLCERVVAIDVDAKDGRDGRPWLEANRHQLPATYEVTTPSGGTHLYYWIPTGAAIPNDTAGKALAPGVDIKANGRDGASPGYVVAGGQPGYIGNGVWPVDLPDWLRDVLCRAPEVATPVLPTHYTPPERHGVELERHCRAIRELAIGEQQGGFTATAFKVGSLVRDGLNWDVAVTELVTAGLAMVNEPGRETWQERDLVAMAERKLAEGRGCPVARIDVTAMGDAPDISHLPGVTQGAGRALQPSEATLRFAFNELDAADLFLKDRINRYRHVTESGQWLVWNGTRWRSDRGNIEIRNDMGRFLARIADADPAGATQGKADKAKMKSDRVPAAVLNIVGRQPGVSLTTAELDADQWLLGVPSGVIDLRSGEMIAPDPDLLITRSTSTDPSVDASCPRFLQFIREACSNDADQVDFLHRYFGYGLTASTREQRFVVLNGPGGDGKSVLLNIVAAILDGYAVTADSSVFVTGGREEHPTALARLNGARMVLASESDANKRWNEAGIKGLSGGDKMAARFMNRDHFEFTPVCKLAFSTNHLPRLENADDAMRRRLLVVPFTNALPVEKQDRHLPEALRREMPGILRWLIDGCLRWQADGLVVPERVQKATDEYFAEADHLGSFLADHCSVETGARVSVHELYSAYGVFMRARGEVPLRENAFGRALKAKGFQPFRTNRLRGFEGIRLFAAGFMDRPGVGNVVAFPR